MRAFATIRFRELFASRRARTVPFASSGSRPVGRFASLPKPGRGQRLDGPKSSCPNARLAAKAEDTKPPLTTRWDGHHKATTVESVSRASTLTFAVHTCLSPFGHRSARDGLQAGW